MEIVNAGHAGPVRVGLVISPNKAVRPKNAKLLSARIKTYSVASYNALMDRTISQTRAGRTSSAPHGVTRQSLRDKGNRQRFILRFRGRSKLATMPIKMVTQQRGIKGKRRHIFPLSMSSERQNSPIIHYFFQISWRTGRPANSATAFANLPASVSCRNTPRKLDFASVPRSSFRQSDKLCASLQSKRTL